MTAPTAPVRVCLFGLGAIGGAVGRALASTSGYEITCAIDADPQKAGRDVRSVLRLKGSSGVIVSDDPAVLRSGARPDVVVHCTGSFMKEVSPQLETIIDAGVPCVSSCEELAFPEAADPVLAAELDRRARAKGVALLGAGVNPGFVMDGLVLALSGATVKVRRIVVERVLDPLSRRRQFRDKVGLGLSFAEASREVAERRMGHIGLKQSAMLIARGMGWNITRLTESVRVLRDGDTPSKRSRRTGRHDARVIGLRQRLVAQDGAREVIRMEMVMAAGVEAPHDAITITGQPDLNLWIQGGIPGDQATVACLINGTNQVLAAPRAGLLTLLDLPLRPSRAAASLVTS